LRQKIGGRERIAFSIAVNMAFAAPPETRTPRVEGACPAIGRSLYSDAQILRFAQDDKILPVRGLFKMGWQILRV
jgi:hypothetical protein